MREFVANSPRGRRAAHQNFGRRRCENILMLQNFCVELLARAMPQTRASSDRICAKFCKNLHERRTKLLQVFHDFDARRTKFCDFFCEDSDLKLARRRRSSNARRHRVAHRKNRAFSAAIAQNFRQKMREFVANSLRGRRATHQQFGQCRCENMVSFQNCCVDLLVRAMPKMRAASGRTCAKFCQNLHQ